MKILRKSNKDKEPLIPNDVLAFTTDSYFFFRRVYDGKWQCVSFILGCQLDDGLSDSINCFYKKALDVYRNGDIIKIEVG